MIQFVNQLILAEDKTVMGIGSRSRSPKLKSQLFCSLDGQVITSLLLNTLIWRMWLMTVLSANRLQKLSKMNAMCVEKFLAQNKSSAKHYQYHPTTGSPLVLSHQKELVTKTLSFGQISVVLTPPRRPPLKRSLLYHSLTSVAE